jgi:hypothetical protein
MRVRRRWIAIALFAAWPVPAEAAAQHETWPPGLRSDVAAALNAELQRAEAAHLPGRSLVLKALEGRSKGASDDQILEAVVALRERLEVAAAVFGVDRGEDVLVAAAGALHAGVTRDALTTMATGTRADALDMALVVVGDLIRRGVPVATATRAVLSLGQAGVDARTFGEFRRSVDDDIRAGLAPARSAELRVRGVLARGGPGGPR